LIRKSLYGTMFFQALVFVAGQHVSPVLYCIPGVQQ